MIVGMSTVRISESDLARDVHGVLEKVQQGVEVIVEQNHRPVAVIKTPAAPGRRISECMALAKAYENKLGYRPVPDRDFAKDVETAIAAHREPLQPPSWDWSSTPVY
jgi:antitoxin (DNA-binding transcriptional repressor) of toxin-antitoxin stability system